ncbi:MAG: SDR family oxidoreductase [Rhodobacteraceae bacterium]|nr:SDR family oxidoreductase [Paracoccaceae bacterium]
MHIFLLGADGFIGRHIATHLRQHGHHVMACARRISALEQMGFTTFQADLTKPVNWAEALEGCDAIVNAAGLLNGSEAHMHAVHSKAPAALYAAAKQANLRKIILISAVGIEANTPFARHRSEGEAVALASGLPTVILRPSMVLGETSYGGSSLMRALAALPLITPMVGSGAQAFDPIHTDDLAATVRQALETDALDGQTLSPCGPERVTQSEMLAAMRAWLGRAPARAVSLPLPLARAMGWLGEKLKLGPISSAAVAQLERGVIADYPAFTKATGQLPRGFSEMLAQRPAGTQDLWHARLYLVRPLIRFALLFMWLLSGLVGLFLPPERFLDGLNGVPLSGQALTIAARGAGFVDVAIAFGLLVAWRLPKLALLQLAMVGSYTLAFGLMAPALWLEPYGGLLKNIPILCLIWVHLILEEER